MVWAQTFPASEVTVATVLAGRANAGTMRPNAIRGRVRNMFEIIAFRDILLVDSSGMAKFQI